MESRVQEELELFKSGYNCAQAVVCTYCDLFGLDRDTAYRMTEGLGAGMGVREVCGAVSGALVLSGVKHSSGSEKPGQHGVAYKSNKMLAEEFTKKNSSIICRELKGIETGEVLRSCGGCIKDACELVEKYLLADQE